MGLPPLKLFNVNPPSAGTLALIGNRHGDSDARSSSLAPRATGGVPSTGAWTPMSPPFNLVQGAAYAANLDIGDTGRALLGVPFGEGKVRSAIQEQLQAAGFGSVQIIHLAQDGARVTGIWTHPSKTGDLPPAIKAAFVDQATLPAQSAAAPPAQSSSTAQIPHAAARPWSPTAAPTLVSMSKTPLGWVAHVKDVQEALILRAMLPVRDPRTGKPNNDGWRYLVTDAAVKRAQAVQGLPQTGIVDTQTWAAIQALPIPLPGQSSLASSAQPYTPPAGPVTAPAPRHPQPVSAKPPAAMTTVPFDDKKDEKKEGPSFLESIALKAKDNPVAATAITIGIIGWAALLLPAPNKAPVGQKA